MKTTNNILTVKDLAAMFGKSEKTIRNRIREIPHYRCPMGIVFKREEIEKWAFNNTKI